MVAFLFLPPPNNPNQHLASYVEYTARFTRDQHQQQPSNSDVPFLLRFGSGIAAGWLLFVPGRLCRGVF